jgi:putative membrane protein
MWWNGPHMFGWGWGFGLMPLLFWVVLIVLIVGLVRASTRRTATGDTGAGRPKGLDILEERYAKGEIQRDEYLEKKRDLGA